MGSIKVGKPRLVPDSRVVGREKQEQGLVRAVGVGQGTWEHQGYCTGLGFQVRQDFTV